MRRRVQELRRVPEPQFAQSDGDSRKTHVWASIENDKVPAKLWKGVRPLTNCLMAHRMRKQRIEIESGRPDTCRRLQNRMWLRIQGQRTHGR